MKKFKKILEGAVSATMIVSALAVPTVALSDTKMSHTYKNGTMYLPNGKIYCTYSTDTAASANAASATASSTRNLTMSVNIRADGLLNAMPAPSKEKSDSISGTKISVSVDNKSINNGTVEYMRFLRAIGTYRIGSTESFWVSVDD